MSKLALYAANQEFKIVAGVCPHDCPDTCSWQVAVDQRTGQAVDLWGVADHPVTQGRLCGKVDRYLERVYHPQRLTTPLRRTGPKGSGQFEAVSWSEALQAIATRLARVIDTDGAQAVLPYSYAGTMGLLQGEGMAQRFFNRMGASHLARTICSEAGFVGYQYTLGRATGMETEAYAHARLILIWGSNTLTSNLHLWPFIQTARKTGARVIVIDPAQTRTARAADEWIPIRPGTDSALALAMMQVIVAEKLHDIDYVKQYTLGFDALQERLQQWSPERAERITGIPADRIRDLARAYATTRPAAIRMNYGLQRHAGGGMASRTIACLPALVGAWRELGGGIQLSTSGLFPFDYTSLRRPDLLAGATPRTLNMIRLGDALSLDPARLALAHHHPRPVDPVPTAKEAGPPVKALVVYNSNPAAVCPQQGAVLAGLRREDLFTVVLEQFQTDTADYADYILPATTQLEHWDIVRAYGHHFVGLNRPAIAPLGEALPNSEIFRRLAAAMGYTDSCFAQSDQEILQEFVTAQTDPLFATLTWEALESQGYSRLNLPDPYLPFAQGNFATPSGKCEFYSQSMAQDGYDPLPNYTPPQVLDPVRHASLPDGAETGTDDRAADAQIPGYSAAESENWLICISPPAHSFLNSTFANVERFLEREGAPAVWIHPQDAAARRVGNGQLVTLWNDLGQVALTARVTEEIMPGTVLAPGIWWSKLSPDGCNINQLTPQDEADMGGGALFYDVRVQVAP